MTTKSIYAPRVVVASQQGSVIHIKSKQSGKVLLKVKLVRTRYGEDQLLLDMAESSAGYDHSEVAKQSIAVFENGGAM